MQQIKWQIFKNLTIVNKHWLGSYIILDSTISILNFRVKKKKKTIYLWSTYDLHMFALLYNFF